MGMLKTILDLVSVGANASVLPPPGPDAAVAGPGIFKIMLDLVSLAANALTIVASGVAIYLFFTKRKEISSAFRLLLNWTFQTTLSDLKGKLDRLNEYNANESSEISEIKNILHEIAGQVRGNSRLQRAAPNLADRLESLAASNRRLTEPNKRSMVAEIREVIRNIQVESMEQDQGNNS